MNRRTENVDSSSEIFLERLKISSAILINFAHKIFVMMRMLEGDGYVKMR